MRPPIGILIRSLLVAGYAGRAAVAFVGLGLLSVSSALFPNFAVANSEAGAKSIKVDATEYSGSDPCAQINAALAVLPATGGTVDASGFTAAQLATPCEVTINVGTPATIIFGYNTWTFQSNPAINIAAGKVTIECAHSSEGDLYGIYPPNLRSAAPAPLISDTVQSFHGTDGFTIRNCYLDGNGIGTFGLFFPYGNAGKIYNIFTGRFTSVGQFTIGGQWVAQSAYSSGNFGDGVVWGYDGSVSGNAQYAGNGGSGFHVVVGGSTLQNQGTYHNRLHGIYIDGTGAPPWSAFTNYIQQHFIRPTVANPGNFAYFTQTVGMTSASQPIFCQTPGCTVYDGSVTWINVGTALGYANESVFDDNLWTELDSTACTDTGYNEPDGFVADNIRVEGTVANPVKFTIINASNCHQSEDGDFNANGIHLLNVNYVNITGFAWLGSGYSNRHGGSGLLLEGAKGVVLATMASWFSYSNAIKIVNSNNSTFAAVVAVNTGIASTPTPDRYAVSIDSSSVAITLDDLNVRDDRSPPFSRGVLDAGSQTMLSNYRGSNLAHGEPLFLGPPVRKHLDLPQPTTRASDSTRAVLPSNGLTVEPQTGNSIVGSAPLDGSVATLDSSEKKTTDNDVLDKCDADDAVQRNRSLKRKCNVFQQSVSAGITHGGTTSNRTVSGKAPASSALSPPATVQRTALKGAPGWEAILVQLIVPPGAEGGKHTQSGNEIVYIQEGSVILEVQGKPAVTLKAGEAFTTAAGEVHNVKNASSSAPAKALAFYVAKKGARMEDLSVPAK